MWIGDIHSGYCDQMRFGSCLLHSYGLGVGSLQLDKRSGMCTHPRAAGSIESQKILRTYNANSIIIG